MKKLIYTVVCMMLFCCACSDADIELNPATQAKQQLAMTFRCGAMSPTRAATNDTRIDDINLYLFPVNGGQARHVYIAPVRPVVLELPKGDYTLYAIANLGHDAGRSGRRISVRLAARRTGACGPRGCSLSHVRAAGRHRARRHADRRIFGSRRGKGQFQLHRGC